MIDRSPSARRRNGSAARSVIQAVTRLSSTDARNTASGNSATSAPVFSSGSAPPAIATTCWIARPAAPASASARVTASSSARSTVYDVTSSRSGGSAVERHDAIPARDERVDQAAAEPAGGAGDEDDAHPAGRATMLWLRAHETMVACIVERLKWLPANMRLAQSARTRSNPAPRIPARSSAASSAARSGDGVTPRA